MSAVRVFACKTHTISFCLAEFLGYKQPSERNCVIVLVQVSTVKRIWAVCDYTRKKNSGKSCSFCQRASRCSAESDPYSVGSVSLYQPADDARTHRSKSYGPPMHEHKSHLMAWLVFVQRTVRIRDMRNNCSCCYTRTHTNTHREPMGIVVVPHHNIHTIPITNATVQRQRKPVLCITVTYPIQTLA